MDRFWSVTTLIGAGIPKQDFLVPWAAKLTARYAVEKFEDWSKLVESDPDGAVDLLKGAHRRTKDKAADRGTDLHKVIEALALGVEPPSPDHPHVQQITRFFAEHEPVFEASESTVYNTRYHYAGTLDGLVRFNRGPLADGKLYLFDAKTTDKSTDERFVPPYSDVGLQLAAYANGEFIGLQPGEMAYQAGRRYYLWDPDKVPHEPMPQVEGAVALAVFPSDYKLHPIDIGDDTWRSFLAVREVARWTLATSRHVVGKAVEVEATEEAQAA